MIIEGVTLSEGNAADSGGIFSRETLSVLRKNRLFGAEGRDRISGFNGPDTLKGRGDGDILLGGAGADRLLGDGDNDILSGGLGQDKLKGGGGSNTFVYEGLHEGKDVILDFKIGQDLSSFQPFSTALDTTVHPPLKTPFDSGKSDETHV